MTYEATIINGVIQLPAHVQLPENSRVLIVVPPESPIPPQRIPTPQLAHHEQAIDFQMDVREIAYAGV
ncbi:MAG: hypothetical protein SH868_13570 [Bythopirellula sp.]|nr:hypothetical protein [Bythopirellula sp.]